MVACLNHNKVCHSTSNCKPNATLYLSFMGPSLTFSKNVPRPAELSPPPEAWGTSQAQHSNRSSRQFTESVDTFKAFTVFDYSISRLIEIVVTAVSTQIASSICSLTALRLLALGGRKGGKRL